MRFSPAARGALAAVSMTAGSLAAEAAPCRGRQSLRYAGLWKGHLAASLARPAATTDAQSSAERLDSSERR